MLNLDNSLDLVRDDNGNHEIVLPYQRFTYNQNRKIKLSEYDDSMIEYNN